MTTYHTLSYLQSKLKAAGLPHNRRTIFGWENDGRLVSPRSVTNAKKIKGVPYPIRMYSDEQVEEIIRAFSPAGIGRWAPGENNG
jgi:hypothetical protein